MHYEYLKRLETYVPEHVRPAATERLDLKAAIDAANLTEMWDMILTLDYGVSDPEQLSPEKRDEFLNVMSLLLQAFDK
ncbi:hypothetical protein [Roseibium sediminicola]|uniref:Uncharacterized protein n=1 Tax=Roseibium sediminicola TaxID=2933272 RepID=A0ABT0GR67_9HYPH|nr:hypothetical protein [Roseibium sp. CAU 1639]MCK7611944.1 hypothetical protein [Roseibium sp. CAU 1639]